MPKRVQRDRSGKVVTPDPQDYFFDPIGTSMPAALMTRFLNPTSASSAINVARRKQATQEFINRMSNWGPSPSEAAKMFAKRFPRIAAHMGASFIDLPVSRGIGIPKAISYPGVRDKFVPEKTPVIFDIGEAKKTPHEIVDTLFHEGTHVAQELGTRSRGGLSKIYSAGEKALKSKGASNVDAYKFNPSEISARRVQSRKMGGKDKPYSMMKGMRSLAQELPVGSLERIDLEKLVGPR